MYLDKNKRSGIIGTTIIHIVVLLVLLFVFIQRPEIQAEGGVPVMLGNVDMAAGDADPYMMTDIDILNQGLTDMEVAAEPDFDDPGSSAGTEIGFPEPSKETDNESKPSVIRKEGITARTDEGGNNQAGATVVEDDFVIDWKDDALEKAMREVTGISDYDIKYSDVVSYTTLKLPSSGIHDVSALAELPNLESLDLSGNKISDVSALAAITNLTWLSLDGNSLVTLDSLKNLRNLKQQLTSTSTPTA